MPSKRSALALVLPLCAACGGAQQGGAPEIDDNFDCRNRRMAYEVTGSFGAFKSGVAVQCEEGVPQLVTFRQETEEDERKKRRHPLGSKEFETLWEKIDSTGWRHLEDCDYMGLETDPQYIILIGDHAAEKKVSCAAEPSGSSKKLQFPHEQIVNELDMKASGLGGG